MESKLWKFWMFTVYLRGAIFAFLAIILFSMNAFAVINDSTLYYSYDDTNFSGSTVYDISGNNNDGTMVSMTTGATGKINEAFEFDGSASHITAGTVFNVNTGDFSVSAWVKFDSLSGGVVAMSDFSNPTNNKWLVYTDQVDQIRFLTKDSSNNDVYSTSTINTGNWYHLVVTRSGSTGKIYLNGTLDTTGNTASGDISSGGTSSIGRFSSTYFDGVIDEFAYYTKELSLSEVQELYNNGAGKNPYTASDFVTNLTDYYNTQSINVDFNSTSNVNMSYYLDGGSEVSLCTNCNYTTTTISSLSEGSHNLSIKVNDDWYNETFSVVLYGLLNATNSIDGTSVSHIGCSVSGNNANSSGYFVLDGAVGNSNINCSVFGYKELDTNKTISNSGGTYNIELEPHKFTITFDASTDATVFSGNNTLREYTGTTGFNMTLTNLSQDIFSVRFGNNSQQVIEIDNNWNASYTFNATVLNADIVKPVSTVNTLGTYVGDAAVEMHKSNKVANRFITSADGPRSMYLENSQVYRFVAVKTGYNNYDKYDMVLDTTEKKIELTESSSSSNILTFTTSCTRYFDNNQTCYINGASTVDSYSYTVKEFLVYNNGSKTLTNTTVYGSSNAFTHNVFIQNDTLFEFYNTDNDFVGSLAMEKNLQRNSSYNLTPGVEIFNGSNGFIMFFIVIIIGIAVAAWTERRVEGFGAIVLILFVYNFLGSVFLIRALVMFGLLMLLVPMVRNTLRNESYGRFLIGTFLGFTFLATMGALFQLGNVVLDNSYDENNEQWLNYDGGKVTAAYASAEEHSEHNLYVNEADDEVYTSDPLDAVFGNVNSINTGWGFLGNIISYTVWPYDLINGTDTQEGLVEDTFLQAMFTIILNIWQLIAGYLLLTVVFQRLRATK